MPKMKTKSAAKKRFRVNANGLVKRSCCGKNHILTKKAQTRKVRLRKGNYVNKTQEKMIQTLLMA